jgi:hypothetical protein
MRRLREKYGSKPMVPNSVVPIANPPIARANSAMAGCAGRPAVSICMMIVSDAAGFMFVRRTISAPPGSSKRL